MATVKVDLPEQLHEQLREFVAHGWFSNEGDLVQEAIRRFLESRTPELMSRFIKQDVDWGLQGNG
jgi:Arc/MetJ-type ribon-helix-helix transcriptional regulator